jgi:Uma2 family endonuclease
MKKLVALDPKDFQSILRRRRFMGADRFDEVWNGVYVMAPNADNVHQKLATRLATVIDHAFGSVQEIAILAGGNVTDQEENWTKNYRVPDVLVFLPGNPAQDRGTHYLGGPDFAVEIVSKRDRSRKKFDFYAKVGVRELLIVDRNPWSLELYREQEGKLGLVGRSEPSRSEELTSTVLPLTFRLLPGDPRPRIEATRPEDGQTWLI